MPHPDDASSDSIPSSDDPPVQTGERRPRSDEDDLLGDDERPHKTARAPPHPMHEKGRVLVRMHHVLCDLQTLIETGHTLLSRERVRGSTFTTKETHKLNLFKELKQFCPTVLDEIRKALDTPDGAYEIYKQLRNGRNAARGEDVHTFVFEIGSWGYTFSPPLASIRKSARGFDHDDCASLLAPASLDISDPVVRERLRNHKQPVEPTDWPFFVFRDQIVNPDDLCDGFLTNELLLRGGVAILRGHQAARNGHASKGGTKCIAHKHKIKKVTAAFICYVAMLVRFALSGQTHFSTDSSGGWPLGKFYTSLLRFIQEKMGVDDRDKLLETWQERIFGDCYDSDRDDDDDDLAPGNEENQPPLTMAQRMLKQQKEKAEVAARRAAEEDARQRLADAANTLNALQRG